jgi:hypothetical protein
MNQATVFSAFNPAEAEVVRSRLEAAGFHAVVINEMAAFTLGLYSPAIPVRVQVPDAEAADARALLATNKTPPPEPS